MIQGMNQIFNSLAQNMSQSIPATDPLNLALAQTLHQNSCKYAFDCSLEVFDKIGQGYLKDDRFKEHINQFSIGTAQYAADAMSDYCRVNI